MQRRGLSIAVLEDVLFAPEQRCVDRPGRCVYQARWTDPTSSKIHLIRGSVDVGRTIPEVVTVYRTSKVQKYWSVSDAGNL
ncbi:MAG: hypothetical protein R3E79_13695 [Caldilineaceae bacterium]